MHPHVKVVPVIFITGCIAGVGINSAKWINGFAVKITGIISLVRAIVVIGIHYKLLTPVIAVA